MPRPQHSDCWGSGPPRRSCGALPVDELRDVEVARVRARGTDLHPLRAAGPVSYWQRALHEPVAPTPAGLGRSSSKDRLKTSSRAAAAYGRTSSTVSGRPSSRAIVVKDASSSPQAVIQLVNGAGIEVDVQRVAVCRHPARDVDADRADLPRRTFEPDTGQPLEASRGRASNAPSVRMTASSRSRQYFRTSRPCRFRSRIG